MAKGYVRKNTSKSTNWGMNNFNEWRDERNMDLLDNKTHDNTILSYWLSRFIIGARQKSGEKYPAKTLYQLLCGINRTYGQLTPAHLTWLIIRTQIS